MEDLAFILVVVLGIQTMLKLCSKSVTEKVGMNILGMIKGTFTFYIILALSNAKTLSIFKHF
jgi:hypothetical protein